MTPAALRRASSSAASQCSGKPGGGAKTPTGPYLDPVVIAWRNYLSARELYAVERMRRWAK